MARAAISANGMKNHGHIINKELSLTSPPVHKRHEKAHHLKSDASFHFVGRYPGSRSNPHRLPMRLFKALSGL